MKRDLEDERMNFGMLLYIGDLIPTDLTPSDLTHHLVSVRIVCVLFWTAVLYFRYLALVSGGRDQ